jgi:predicted RNA binding protein YcfA (HicA-like mRNA interferase family)
MPKLRRLSGPDVISILQQFGFVIHKQSGSHIKLRRIGPASEKQTLTVPNHRQLDTFSTPIDRFGDFIFYFPL